MDDEKPAALSAREKGIGKIGREEFEGPCSAFLLMTASEGPFEDDDLFAFFECALSFGKDEKLPLALRGFYKTLEPNFEQILEGIRAKENPSDLVPAVVRAVKSMEERWGADVGRIFARTILGLIQHVAQSRAKRKRLRQKLAEKDQAVLDLIHKALERRETGR